MEIRKIIDKWSTEKLSHAVLYGLLGLSAVVFGLFYLIGYDRPFEENPQFTAPLLTNILLVFIALVFVLALALGIWTLAVSIRRRKGEGKVVNGVPVAKITYGIVGFTILLLLVTFLLGSSSALSINGATFSASFWLKTADMFVWSAIILIVVAVGLIIWSKVQGARSKVQGAQ